MAWADFQTAFYNRVWGPIQQVAAEIGVDPRIIFAQAALESNWGRSTLSTGANNYFGIKARTGEPSVAMRTREVTNGVSTYVTARFAKFDDVLDSIRGYGEFISRNPRYQSFIGATNLDDELRALQASGYATDPNYATKLRQVINNMPDFSIGGGAASRPLLEGAPPAIPGERGQGLWNTEAELDAMFPNTRAIGNPIADSFSWVKDLFSLNTGTRFVAIILGIAFIIIAIIALMMTSDTVQGVAN